MNEIKTQHKEDVKKLLKESYAYTNSAMINDLPNEQQRVDLFLNELAEKDKLTIKRPFNEWTPTPPTYKFTQPEYVKLKKNWCKNFNFKINVKPTTEDTQPEGEREMNDWMKGLAWGIIAGILLASVIWVIVFKFIID